MSNCIFCQIIAGKIPCYKIYEDNDFVAFLDANPLNPGHTLVMPKKHYRWVLDVPAFTLYWETAGKIAKKIKQSLKADSINFITLGYEINHAHIHIIPRFVGDDLGMTVNWSKKKQLSKAVMERLNNKIKI